MSVRWLYRTPEEFSDLWMMSDGEVLTGVWFIGSKDEQKHRLEGEERMVPVFAETIAWLDRYFAGDDPGKLPPYTLGKATPFRRDVVECMLDIPYGTTCSYGDIARKLALKYGKKRMSAQAVGGAVGWNPICILIPCHRVVGADGSLTGYGGGLSNKVSLLKKEGISLPDPWTKQKD